MQFRPATPIMSAADAHYCERLTRRHARTFYLASLLLPGIKRRGAYALYAFCRVADDLVDGPAAASPLSTAAQLAAYRTRLDEALQGRPSGPVFRELAWAVAHFGLPIAALHELLDGVAADLSRSRWETWVELERYCQGVAGSVGEMCAAIFGTAGAQATSATVVGRARALGVAMQLTNILRDVGEDWSRGMLYLPQDELARFGVSTDDLPAQRGTRGFRDFMEFQIHRARRLYDEGLALIPLLTTSQGRIAFQFAADAYSHILEKIRENGYDVFSRRASVSLPGKLGMVPGSMWRALRAGGRVE